MRIVNYELKEVIGIGFFCEIDNEKFEIKYYLLQTIIY